MDINNANKDVNDLFRNLSPMITKIVGDYSKEVDKIIDNLSNEQSLSNEEIRKYMLALSIETYMFGMSKDASIMKQECADTLLKEKQANIYNSTQGTVSARENESLMQTTDKQVIKLVYSGVANMMKTKLDEAHRLVNALNSILISRNAEAKLEKDKSDLLAPQEVF